MRNRIGLLGLALALCLSVPVFAAEEEGFSDVDGGKWYAPAVAWCRESGLMVGTSDTEFSPGGVMTRAMLATVLHRAAGSPEAEQTASFSDAEPDSWYSGALNWAAETGTMQGYGNGAFGVKDPVTREQLAAVLWRRQGEPVPAGDDGFSDAAEVSDYAAEAVLWVREAGIMYQIGGDRFGPGLPARRSEVAAALYGTYCENRQPLEPDMTIVSPAELEAAMAAYEIAPDHSAALALSKINDVYGPMLTEAQRRETLVFFFEGAGCEPDPALRHNALCVVIRDGRIVHLNLSSTTLPDYPFLPWKNDGYDMPTLKSGVYSFDTVNHKGRYAALRVLKDQVVRFHTETEFYESISNNQSIEAHRRATAGLAPAEANWANSVGCITVGYPGAGAGDVYAGFIQALGAVPEGSDGNTPYLTNVTGLLIADRSLAEDYMKAVGYTEEAIAMIG